MASAPRAAWVSKASARDRCRRTGIVKVEIMGPPWDGHGLNCPFDESVNPLVEIAIGNILQFRFGNCWPNRNCILHTRPKPFR